MLTNGDLDHCLGLLSLREWTPLALYATRATHAGLVQENAVFRTLERQRPHLLYRGLELQASSPGKSLALAAFSALCDAAGEASGLSVAAFRSPARCRCTSSRVSSRTPRSTSA